MSEPRVIVCGPADTELMIPGSSVDRRCSACNMRVMVSPVGEKAFADGTAKALCIYCYFKVAKPEDVFCLLETPEAIVDHFKQAVPNPWRGRN